jgi:2-hydroxycyclohexanecarboxyl-CoA dehydrogenase
VIRKHRILLTGAGSPGCLGEYLYKKLREQGHEVLGVGKHGPDKYLDFFEICYYCTLLNIVRDFQPTVLINNAALLDMCKFGKTTETTWNRTVKANITVPFQLTQAFCEIHGEKIYNNDRCSDFRVVNISSMAASIGMREATPYVVTKAGLEAMTRNLAREFAGCDILSFFAIAPCMIDTSMSAEMTARRQPIPAAEPADVWRLVDFCVNHAPHTASGSVFPMAAGMGV